MARLLLLLLVVCAACLSGADGKFFASEKVAQPTIPYQRALIAYDGHDETLVVESTLNGPPGEYSWVIPLPREPKTLEPVDKNFFENLDNDLQPYIVKGNALSMLFAVYMALGLLIIVCSAPYRYNLKPSLLALVMAGEAVLMFFVAVVLTGLTGPDSGGCKKSDDSAGGVSVLQSKVVGSYQIDVVKGADAKELIVWLRRNGTPLPDDTRDVVDQYAREGWVFMAAKLAPHKGGQEPQHPIKVVFPLPKREGPIYPMRLTGVTDEPLVLDLFVVGPGAASVDSSSDVYNSNLATRGLFDLWVCRSLERHPIEGLPDAEGNRYASRLRAELYPIHMQDDLAIEFGAAEESQLTVYDAVTGANYVVQQGAMWFSLVLGAGALIFVGRLKRVVIWLVLVSLLVALAAGSIAESQVKIVETEVTHDAEL